MLALWVAAADADAELSVYNSYFVFITHSCWGAAARHNSVRARTTMFTLAIASRTRRGRGCVVGVVIGVVVVVVSIHMVYCLEAGTNTHVIYMCVV